MSTLIGDVRWGMEEQLRGTIEHILNTKSNYRQYWILIHAKFEGGNIFSSKVVILPYEPPKMLGTVCFYVNNRVGYYRQLWALPLDCPNSGQIVFDNPNVDILQSIKDMPIIH